MTDSQNSFQKVLDVHNAKQRKMADLAPSQVLDHIFKQDMDSLDEASFVAKYGEGSILNYKMNAFEKRMADAFNPSALHGVGQNTNKFEDVLTGAGISLGDKVPELVSTLGYLATAPNNGKTSPVSDWFMEGIQGQKAEADASRLNYSEETQAATQEQRALAAIRNSQFDTIQNASLGDYVKDFGEGTGEYLTNPASIIPLASESADSIITMPIGGAITGSIVKAGVKKGLERGTAAVSAEKMAEALTKAQLTGAGAFGTGYTAVSEGGHNAGGVLEEFSGIPLEVLAQSPEFQRLSTENPDVSPEEIRKAMGLSGSKETLVTSGAIAAVIGKATGASDLFSKALIKDTLVKEATKKSFGAAIANTGKVVGEGGLKEGIEEIGQSGSGQVISNLAIGEGDTSVSPTRGVNDAMSSGLVAGVASGGTVAGGLHIAKGVVTPSEKELPEVPTEHAALAEKIAAFQKKSGEGAVDTTKMDSTSRDEFNTLKLQTENIVAERDLAESQGDQDAVDRLNKSLNAVQTRGANVLQADTTKLSKEHVVELSNLDFKDAASKEKVAKFLSEFSMQMDSLDEDELKSVRNSADQVGIDTKELDVLISLKTMGETSENIRVGDAEWEGAVTYAQKIQEGIKHNAPAYVAKILDKMADFSAHMNEKAVAFQTAYDSIKGKSGRVELPDYTQLNGRDAAYVHSNSGKLVTAIAEDARILQEATTQLYDLVMASPIKDAVTELSIEYDLTLPSTPINPVPTVESAVVDPEEDIIQEDRPESVAEPVSKQGAVPTASTEENVQDLTEDPRAEENVPPIEEAPSEEGSKVEPVKTESTLQERMTSKIAEVINPSAKKWLPKEQIKTEIATQFIGDGSKGSSTAAYEGIYNAEGVSNTGEYTAEDVVYVSSNGNRKGRVNPVVDGVLQGAYQNIAKAIEAGATLVMDTAAHLESTKNYNLGEIQLAKYLEDHGYVRKGETGEWVPNNNPPELKQESDIKDIFTRALYYTQPKQGKKATKIHQVIQRGDALYKESGYTFSKKNAHKFRQELSKEFTKRTLTKAIALVGKYQTESNAGVPFKPEIPMVISPQAYVVKDTLLAAIKRLKFSAKTKTASLVKQIQEGIQNSSDESVSLSLLLAPIQGFNTRFKSRVRNQILREVESNTTPKAKGSAPVNPSFNPNDVSVEKLNQENLAQVNRLHDLPDMVKYLLEVVKLEVGNQEIGAFINSMELPPGVDNSIRKELLRSYQTAITAPPKESPLEILQEIKRIAKDPDEQSINPDDLKASIEAVEASLKEGHPQLNAVLKLYNAFTQEGAKDYLNQEIDPIDRAALELVQEELNLRKVLPPAETRGDTLILGLNVQQRPDSHPKISREGKEKTVNEIFLEDVNEIVEEAHISQQSSLGNHADTMIQNESWFSETIQETLTSKKVPKESIEKLLTALEHVNVMGLVTQLQEWFTVDMEAKDKANSFGRSRKLYTNRRSLLTTDSEGKELSPLFSLGGVLSTLFNLSIKSFTPTSQGMKTLVNIKDRGALPVALSAYLQNTKVGLPPRDVARDIGKTLLEMIGMTFDGSHANTSEVIQYSLGQMMLDFLLSQGILQEQKFSTTWVNSLGGDIALNVPSQGRTLVVEEYADIASVASSTKAELFLWNGKFYQWELDSKKKRVGRFATILNVHNPRNGFKLTAKEINTDLITTIQVNAKHPFWETLKESNLREVSSLLGKAFQADTGDSLPSIGKAPRNNNRIRGQVNTLSRTTLENANKNSRVKHYLSNRMDTLLGLVPEENILAMLGWKNLETTKQLPDVRAAQVSKNAAAEKDLEGYKILKANILNEGTQEFNQPYFYGYKGQPYHRLTVGSQTFNGQSSKFHRFMSHMEPREMNMEDATQATLLQLAVAQSIGFKVDNQPINISLAQLDEFMLEHEELISNLQKAIAGTAHDVELLKAVVALSEEKEKTHTLQGLVEYAHYLNAVQKGDKEFTVTIAIEIDGRNNGPVTSLIMSAKNKEDAIRFLRKGGITDGSTEPQSVGDRMGDPDVPAEHKQGIYEEVSETIQIAINSALFERTQEDMIEQGFPLDVAKARLFAQLELKEMTDLIALEKNEEGGVSEVTVERKEGKENVVLQAFYGSGDNSLTKVDVRGMLEAITTYHQSVYESLPEGITALPKAYLTKIQGNFRTLAKASVDIPSEKQLQELLEDEPKTKVNKAFVARNSDFVKKIQGKSSIEIQNLVRELALQSEQAIYAHLMAEFKKYSSGEYFGLDMQIPAEVAQSLELALKGDDSYTAIKLKAFRALYADAMHQFKIIKNMMSITGPMGNSIYMSRYTQLLRQKGYSTYQDLSVKDKREMLKELSRLLPSYSLSYHNDKENFTDAIAGYSWDIAAREAIPPEMRGLTNLGKGLDSYLRTRVISPIGTGANPSTTISIADAAVISDLFGKGLDVFSIYDGILINAMDQNLLVDAANQSYLDGILENNQLEKVVESFDRMISKNFNYEFYTIAPSDIVAMLNSMDFQYKFENNLTQKKIKKWAQELLDPNNNAPNQHEAYDEVFSYIMFLRAEATKALSKTAYQETLRGFESTAVNQFGSINGHSTVVGKLPEIAEPNLEELSKEEKPRRYRAPESSVISDQISGISEHTDTPQKLSRFLRGLLEKGSARALPKAYRSFLNKVLIERILVPALTGSALKVVVFRTEAQRLEFAKTLNSYDASNFENPRFKGSYHGGTHTIYLNAGNGLNVETVFHELIHAALDKVLTEKISNGSVNRIKVEETIEAILEPAEKAWKEKFGKGFPIFNKDPASRMKELFAWGLSNFDLIVLLDSESNAEVNEKIQADKTHPLRAFKTFMVNWIQDIVNWSLGRYREVNDSVLAFLVTTAAENALRAKEKNDPDAEFSYQLDSINEATPQVVFDNLLGSSTGGGTHKAHLTKLFNKEIKRLQNSKIPLLKEKAVNAMEALIHLQQQGTSITPHRLEGLFPMSNVEAYLFNNYRDIIQVGLDEFGMASTEMSELFTKARSKIKVQDFLLEGESGDIALAIAQSKHDAIFNSAHLSSVEERSAYLADFISLARTNEDFRRVLSKQVGFLNNREGGVDTAIGTRVLEFIQKVIGYLTGTYTGSNKVGSFKGKIDRISRKLSVSEFKAKTVMEKQARRAFNKGGKAYSAYAQWMGARYEDIASSDTAGIVKEAITNTKSVVKDAITGANNTEQAERYNKLHQMLHHNSGVWLTRLIETEFTLAKGYSKNLKRAIFMKSKAVAGAADGAVKAVQSILKTSLGKQSERTMLALTEGVLRTDLSVFQGWSIKGLMELYKSPEALQKKITELENTLRAYSSGEALINAAHSLGHFQIHHKGTEAYTFPNAEAIALNLSRLFKEVLTSEVSTIDQLASLVAIQQLSTNTKERVLSVYQSNPKAVKEIIELHRVQKQVELRSRYAGDVYAPLKGNVTENFDSSRDIKVVPREAVADLKHDGYRELYTLQRNIGDPSTDPMVVMYSTVGGLNGWVQGAFSTATNRRGIHNLDGRTITNGYDTYDAMQKNSVAIATSFKAYLLASNVPKTKRAIVNNGTMTTVSNTGTVTGQQYTIGLKEKQRYLGNMNGILEVLPRMYGHNIVVTNTGIYNQKVNEALKAGYEYDKKQGQLHTYMEVSPKAPTREGREAYRMMPPEARDHAKTIWGDKMYVKTSLYEMTFGYRKVSMANILKANSDSPQWAKTLLRSTLGLFLTDAQIIHYISIGGKVMEEAVDEIKDMIVVRSIKVLIDNLLSNTVQLVLENKGMTISKAVRYTIEGLRLAKRYQENSFKLHRLQYEVSIERNPSKRIELKSSIAILLEEQAKNPAKHLIDAGALTAIVEDLGENANPYSYSAKLGKKFDRYNSQLPESVQWVTGNLLGSKQSEWYKTAYKFTQLGDFGSRYAMEKNARENGTMNEEFMDRIMEAFVMYDLPSNKYLEWLGGTGTLWFMKYFLRIQAIILRNIKENPRKVAEFAAMVNMMGLDVPSYYQALFLMNPLTNKMGQLDYAEKGIEALPVMHMYDMF